MNATSTTLPVDSFGAMVVDQAHSQIFVSGPESNEILVLDFNGNVQRTIGGEPGARGMVLSDGTLYVSLSTSGLIDRVSTATDAETSSLTTQALDHPTQLVFAGGYLWAAVADPNDAMSRCISRVDVQTGTVLAAGYCLYGMDVRSDPENTTRLIAWADGLSPATVAIFDVSSGSLTQLVSGDVSSSHLQDVAPGITGTTFVTADGSPYEFDELRYSDLKPTGVVYPATMYPDAVAVTSAGGGLVAGGLNAEYGNSLWLYAYDQPTVQLYSGTYGAEVLPGGLTFSPGGKLLFAVIDVYGNPSLTFAVLHVPPTLLVGDLVPAHGSPAGGTPVTINGTGFDAQTSTCQVTAIHFGSVAASVPPACTDSSVTTTAPAGWPGVQDVTVTTTAGTTPTTPLDQFTYDPLNVLAVSNAQYHLTDSDGSTWTPIDSNALVLDTNPQGPSTALLGANADLWTATSGYNQDIGIEASVDSGPPQLLGWKESGGSAGTFSPNAAYLQVAFPMTAGHAYVFMVVWKTNRAAPGVTVFAGAGPFQDSYSPTRLSERVIASPGAAGVVVTDQYELSGASAANWYEIDPSLSVALNPGADATAILGANADLWTADSGWNQDLGIFVSVDGGAYVLAAWKESGGSAGTYSPNAAYLKTAFPLQHGHSYSFVLAGRPNRDESDGESIFIGAGPIGGAYSPTSLTVETALPGVTEQAVSLSQYHLTASDGSTWVAMDGGTLQLTYRPTATGTVMLGANADLWTAESGYNQDLGISMSEAGSTPVLIGWKESGGSGGTFSPNAAYLEAGVDVSAGVTYTFTLVWKTNRPAPAATVFAGAGPVDSGFSPTSLSIEGI